MKTLLITLLVIYLVIAALAFAQVLILNKYLPAELRSSRRSMWGAVKYCLLWPYVAVRSFFILRTIMKEWKK